MCPNQFVCFARFGFFQSHRMSLALWLHHAPRPPLRLTTLYVFRNRLFAHFALVSLIFTSDSVFPDIGAPPSLISFFVLCHRHDSGHPVLGLVEKTIASLYEEGLFAFIVAVPSGYPPFVASSRPLFEHLKPSFVQTFDDLMLSGSKLPLPDTYFKPPPPRPLPNFPYSSRPITLLRRALRFFQSFYLAFSPLPTPISTLMERIGAEGPLDLWTSPRAGPTPLVFFSFLKRPLI